MRQTVGCSLSGLPSESPYVLVDGAEPNDSLSARRAYIGSLYLRDEVRLQRCNYRLVVVLCERPTSLRPYKSEGRGPQGELCDHFVVRCFNNGHGIILARYEVKGF